MRYLEAENEMIKIEKEAVIKTIYHIVSLYDILDGNNLGIIFKMLYIDKLSFKYICQKQFIHIRTLYNLRKKFIRFYLRYR